MERKKFFQGVKDFKKFKHSRVTDLFVDEELVSFLFKPLSSEENINVSIDLHDSPFETHVFMGEKEHTFRKKYLPEIVDSIIKIMDGESGTPSVVPPSVVPAATAAAAPEPPTAGISRQDSSDAGQPLTRSTDGLTTSTSAFGLPEPTEIIFDESVTMENGAEMKDSRGIKFTASHEFKNDVDLFKRIYGERAIHLTVIEDNITMMLDLGVADVIGRDTMLAWGFDERKRVYARMKTSIYYRDGTHQKVSVQEGLEPNSKFVPQFQLESIINNYVSATWAHGSKPFVNPVYKAEQEEEEAKRAAAGEPEKKKKSYFGGKKSAPPPPTRVYKRKPVVSENLRQLVTMGFDIAKAKKALMLADGDLQSAIGLCCEYGDGMDTSDLDQEELSTQLAFILSGQEDDGKDYIVEEVTPSKMDDTTYEIDPTKSYLVELVQYVQSRIPTLNQFCVICDQKHLLGHMLKPTVCTRELCCWSFQELGVASSATDFVASSQDVVDMLLLFAKEAVRSSRSHVIFTPYPLVFDPHNAKVKIFDPARKEYDKVRDVLSRIPEMKTIIQRGGKLTEELAKVSPYAYPLLNWVIASNRSFFVKLPPELVIRSLGGEQFLMLSSPPEKEKVFRSYRKQYGSVYAFHGSPIENWHSIVRNGLKNASGTSLQINGAAYGKGIYMSPYLSVAAGYAARTSLSVVAVVEVINHDIHKANDQIWTVANESYVTTRMLLMYKGGSFSMSSSTTGSSIASNISAVMSKYGVS